MPSKSKFLIDENKGHSKSELFYGITDDNDYNLFDNYVHLKGEVPDEVIPIAEDAGGNRICIGLSGNYLDKIYFYDHEEQPGKNLYYICDGFSEFLNRLE
jgi:hypothetical protein